MKRLEGELEISFRGLVVDELQSQQYHALDNPTWKISLCLISSYQNVGMGNSTTLLTPVTPNQSTHG